MANTQPPTTRGIPGAHKLIPTRPKSSCAPELPHSLTTPLSTLLTHILKLRGSPWPSVFDSSLIQFLRPNQCPSLYICGSFPSQFRVRYRTGRLGAHKSVEIDRSKPKGDHRCGDGSAPRRAGRRANYEDRAMELLASSNRGGPLKCLKANVNADRGCRMPVALVAVSISALLATGCVSLDAPPSPFGSVGPVDLERSSSSEDLSLYIGSVGDTFSALIGAASVRSSGTRETFFEPRAPLNGPVVANRALSVSDNRAWQFAPNDSVTATPISVAVDLDPTGFDPHSWMFPTDLLAEPDPAAESEVELADARVFLVDARPLLIAPTRTLVSPMLSSTTTTTYRDVWQGVMKATAVGFLAVVLMVPVGCSFAAGVVCTQPRAGPRRRRAIRQGSGRFLAGLSRAIANVPAH